MVVQHLFSLFLLINNLGRARPSERLGVTLQVSREPESTLPQEVIQGGAALVVGRCKDTRLKYSSLTILF